MDRFKIRTLKEALSETKDFAEYKENKYVYIHSQLSLLDRAIYFNLSDYLVSGVSGIVLFLYPKNINSKN